MLAMREWKVKNQQRVLSLRQKARVTRGCPSQTHKPNCQTVTGCKHVTCKHNLKVGTIGSCTLQVFIINNPSAGSFNVLFKCTQKPYCYLDAGPYFASPLLIGRAQDIDPQMAIGFKLNQIQSMLSHCILIPLCCFTGQS